MNTKDQQRISWGTIGCGNVTEKKSGSAFNKVEGSKLDAVMRTDAAKAADYAKRHGYDHADELINERNRRLAAGKLTITIITYLFNISLLKSSLSIIFLKMNVFSKLTILSCCAFFLTITVQAQHIPNWQNQDLASDGIFGISTEKAYTLLQGKKSKTVIVAVVDGGVDTLHEDLQRVLWVNTKKKGWDNGTYGWSFIGSAKGNVHYDNLELARQVRQYEQRDTTKLNDVELMVYHNEKQKLQKELSEAQHMQDGMGNFIRILDTVVAKIGKADPGTADFKVYQSNGEGETHVRETMISILADTGDYQTIRKEQLDAGYKHYADEADYQLNTSFDPRAIVGDDYFNSQQRDYGCPDVMGPDAEHGTHVSGIIAGIRGNDLGADGIADNVKIMVIRVVPDGDERDKDVASGIRYAADHGAKVINMSFGKPYSQDKKVVDEAVKYALKKDVLLVQAAGNDNANIDSVSHFPNRGYMDGGEAGAYIVVGASGMKNDTSLKASFSNYGKNSVDVFAPGVQIYSSIPGSKYAYFDGTSMACPVVAGLAALIREYYPKLSALQVKEIILASVVKSDYLEGRCLTGGVVNTYNALQLAAQREARL